MKRITVFLLLLGGFLWGCKTQKKAALVSDNSLKPDTTEVIREPVYLVTQLGDTLDQLGDEVDIEIVRVRKDTVTLIGVGDIMMGTNFPSKNYLPANNASDLWEEVKDTLMLADVTFGNLEGVILDDGGEQKKCKNPKVCYLFRSPESYVENLIESGFDAVSLANNHAGDFGQSGRDNTMRVLDSVGIHFAGLLSRPITIFKKEGMMYGLAAFSPNRGTQLIHHEDEAIKLVSKLDSLVDIVIVSFHAGAEGEDHQHVTRKREFYYGEDRGNVYDFSRKMVDAGADVIFGHGPHVTRAFDLYKDRFIAYSLGNFCTYGRFSLRGVKGIAPIAKVYTDADGRFLKGELISVKQLGAGGPKLDSKKKAIKIAKELTEKDFPESKIQIDDSGFIFYIDR
ncbi:CapA family protein [Reichenbachiella versicolor]|uniref:CapA family protein n=1 Tax=Reichenbachiella versicolor TaxID=1821036 RepID=UPI000D6E1577|nr:CapA family protein [Reichenbachiella versicolor]